jgi:hypothetical protein
MTRRLLTLLLLFPAAACLAADAETETRDLIASAARALSAGKVELFLDAFDPAMPGFGKLRDHVAGLTGGFDVGCNIEIARNEGDAAERTLTLDWILTMEHKDNSPGAAQRQKTVKCRLKKTGKKWRIVSFDPLDLFAAPAE